MEKKPSYCKSLICWSTSSESECYFAQDTDDFRSFVGFDDVQRFLNVVEVYVSKIRKIEKERLFANNLQTLLQCRLHFLKNAE